MRKNIIFIVSLVTSLAVNVIFMQHGIFDLTQHLYYIPVLLGVFYYEKAGIGFAGLTVFLYFGTVLFFDSEHMFLLPTLVRCVILIAIAFFIYRLLRRNKERQAELQNFFDISADMMCISNGRGYFTKVNHALCEILGYSEEELRAQPFLSFVHPDDIKATMDAAAKVRASESIMDFTNRYRRSDGTYRYFEWRAVLNGEAVYLTARDITERVQMIHQLQQNNYRMQIAENLANMGSWEVSLETGICTWSKGLYELLGLKPDSLEPKSDSLGTFVHPDDADRVIGKIKRAIETRTGVELEHRIVRTNGTVRWVVSKGTYIRNPQTGEYRYIELLLDITENKKANRFIDQSLKRYENLARISAFSAKTEQELLDEILSQGMELTESKRGYLFFYNALSTSFVLKAQHLEKPCSLENGQVTPAGCADLCVVLRAVKEKECIIINDVQHSDLSFECLEDTDGLHKMMAIPVFDGEQVVAVACVGNRAADYEAPEDLQMMLYMKGAWEIVKRQKAEKELLEEQKWLETTLLSIGDGVIVAGINGVIHMINREAVAIMGYTREEAVGKSLHEVFKVFECNQEEPHSIRLSEILEKGETSDLGYEVCFFTRDGVKKDLDVKVCAIMLSEEEMSGFVITFRDITEKKRTEQEITYLTYHDKMTGLYNRRYFEEQILRVDIPANLPSSIIIGDVNGLKLINDAFGHLAGDRLLVTAGQIMREVCRKDDIVARWGGDEYIIFLPRTGEAEAEHIAERIHKQCAEKYVSDINLSISLGFATKLHAKEDIMKVIKQADDLMYKNKLAESRGLKSRAVRSILNILHERNAREERHSNRVAELCGRIGQAMGLDKNQIADLVLLGQIHDIGKAAIDGQILNKKGALTPEEYAVIKQHCEKGYNIIGASPDLSYLADCVLAHHERWDGTGYPNGIKGEDIPLYARILTVADAFEAMTSSRPYRDALSEQEALNQLKVCAATQFDPEVVRSFASLYESQG